VSTTCLITAGDAAAGRRS